MKTNNEVVKLIEDSIESTGSIDEALRSAVRILKGERDYYNWVGVYLLEGDTLVLHNYIGKPTEHIRIPIGKGVCGTAVALRENQLVSDVTKLENYLACSVETRAEIVVLIRRGDVILGQIDIDSDVPNAFTAEDESLLICVANLLAAKRGFDDPH